MSHKVKLFGAERCHKARFYRDILNQRGVSHAFLDVEENEAAARELRSLYDDGGLKFPTLLINGKRVRNPSVRALDKVLARDGLFDPGVIHEPQAKRFVRYMKPKDAFVSYTGTDSRLALSYIEVPTKLRGNGLGTKLAKETFALVRQLGWTVRITCAFLRHVAASDPEWSDYFGIRL